jgi:putative transposase
MVSHPAEYPWSSYRANAQGESSKVITPHSLYTSLGSDDEMRKASYRELFRYHLDPGMIDKIRTATNGNYALGSSRFQKQMKAALNRRVTPGKSGRPRKEKAVQSLELFSDG